MAGAAQSERLGASRASQRKRCPPPSPAGEGVEVGDADLRRDTLATLGKAQLPAQLARWLDALDETGRWALLKLVTGGVAHRRVGAARQDRGGGARRQGRAGDRADLAGPRAALSRAVRLARRPRREAASSRDPAPFRPAMLAHAHRGRRSRRARSRRLHGGMEMGRHPRAGGRGAARRRPGVARLYSRTGEDISKSFPDLLEALRLPGAIDGELLIVREGRVQTFNVLQQRLNRKTVTPSCSPNSRRICAPMISWSTATEDLRELPFAERRARLEHFVARLDDAAHRSLAAGAVPHLGRAHRRAADPAAAGAGADAEAVEGVMLKRRDAPYLPGRPKGPWWKWKRDPFIVDAVLMYAQRGHGKRSSYYSDYTFGVWTSGRGRRRAGAGRQGLFRLHRRGAAPDRPLRAPQHRRALRPGARGGARGRTRAWCSRSRSRACSARPATNPASPCASRASAGCAGTSRRGEADRLETLERMLKQSLGRRVGYPLRPEQAKSQYGDRPRMAAI